jgi:hypothetical protein
MPCPKGPSKPQPAAAHPTPSPKTIDVEVTIVLHTAKDALLQPHLGSVKSAVETALKPVAAELKKRNVQANVSVVTAAVPPSDDAIMATGKLPANQRSYWVYVLSDERQALHLLLKHAAAAPVHTDESELRKSLHRAFSGTDILEGITVGRAGTVPARASFDLGPSEVIHFQNVVVHELGHAISQNPNPKADHATNEIMQGDLTDITEALGYADGFVKHLADKIETGP